MNTVLAVTDAHKCYGTTAALKGAAMSLGAREWLALLGPNGAGKTTLIRAIAGRVRLDRGQIALLGETLRDDDVHRGTQARRCLGMVPQEIALYPLLSAEENLRGFAILHGVPRGELRDRVSWALDWTGLADRAKSLVKSFSGGMKRRLNIACGVLHHPKVVLLDEPTVGVDPQSRERIWSMLGQLRDQGASLLLTTHQLDEAQQICDRITIIDHGHTIADGTLAQLVERTIGRGRRATFILREQTANAPPGGAWSADRRRVSFDITDAAADLPGLLEQFATAGVQIDDLQLDGPTLQSVFLRLTGRELRE